MGVRRKLKKNLCKIVLSILLIFIGFTFLIAVIKLPHDTINYSSIEGKFIFNINWGEIKDIVKNTYKILFKGSLGVNLEGNFVWDELRLYFKNTMMLLIPTLAISTLLGIIIGASISLKIKYTDNSIKVIWRTIFRSLPEPLMIFLMYLIVLKVFEFKSIVPEGVRNLSLPYYILPIILLSIFPTMNLIRITSKNAIEVYDFNYGKEYLISAQLKGASTFRTLNIHLLKNVFTDVIKDIPSYIGLMLTNLMIVEYLFNFPGLTFKLIKSYGNKDVNTVFGIMVILVLVYLLFYLMFKIAAKIIEPSEDKTVPKGSTEVIM